VACRRRDEDGTTKQSVGLVNANLVTAAVEWQFSSSHKLHQLQQLQQQQQHHDAVIQCISVITNKYFAAWVETAMQTLSARASFSQTCSCLSNRPQCFANHDSRQRATVHDESTACDNVTMSQYYDMTASQHSHPVTLSQYYNAMAL